jgi:lipid-A-disaccharide synthase-like uncharacterized protein
MEWLRDELTKPLVLFGFAGQFIFFLRFAVQWFATERRGRMHIPVAFWYLSIGGGLITLIYAVLKRDLVISVAQALGLLIYSRNLMIIYRRRGQLRRIQALRAAADAKG